MINDDVRRRRRRHFLWNCRPVIWIITASVQQYRWRCTSL
jgi:hypothetical protein